MEKKHLIKTYQVEVLTDAEAKDLFTKAKNIYQCNLKGKAVDETRSLIIKISTIQEDRSKDIVVPTGVILDNYLNNPVVAAFHKYDKPSIGRTVQIAVSETDILAKMEFAPKGVNPEADMLYSLYSGGFQHAASIGFISSNYETLPSGGTKFVTWEMLEWSCVLVPDNAGALSEAVKSKGFDLDAIVKEQEEAVVKALEEDAPVTDEPVEQAEDKKVSELTAKELTDLVTATTREKDISEVTALAYLASDLNWYIKAFTQNGVSEETINKLLQALELIMSCIQEQAVLGQKDITIKAGRTISKKHEALIKSCIENLSTVLASLGEEEEEKEIIETPVEKGTVMELLREMTKHSKKADKHTGLSLQLAKQLSEVAKGGDK